MPETFEVELKIRVPDLASTEAMLLKMGAEPLNAEVQTDVYFDHPCKSFEESDEAIRIRSRVIESGHEAADEHPAVELTYKGPKVDSITKTRAEYSVGLDDVMKMTQILKSAGFKEVASIVKRRKFLRIDDTTVSLDDVKEVGSYVEFEVMATGEAEMDEARTRMLSLVSKLGFSPEESVRESYLELYLHGRE